METLKALVVAVVLALAINVLFELYVPDYTAKTAAPESALVDFSKIAGF